MEQTSQPPPSAAAVPCAAMQLDLFVDNREEVERHALRRALGDDNLDLAQSLLNSQRSGLAELPTELDRLQRLFAARLSLSQAMTAPTAQRQSSATAVADDCAQLSALARVNLGSMAQNYLTHLWSALAQALADCPFQPDQPQRHCTAPLRLLGRWDAVRLSIE